MLMLPKNLAAVSKIAAKEQARFALQGIKVQEFADNRYAISATDGTIAVIVRGEGCDAAPWPDLLRLNNDCFDYLVDGKEWLQFFSKAQPQPHLGQREALIGLCAEAEEKDENGVPSRYAQVCLSDGKLSSTIPVTQGHFPDVTSVMPKGPAPFAIKVNAVKLHRLLEAAMAFTQVDNSAVVSLLFWSENKVMGVAAKNSLGQLFDGVLMPVFEPSCQAKPASEPMPEAEALEEEPEADEPEAAAEDESQPEPAADVVVEQSPPSSQPCEAHCNGHSQADLPGAEPIQAPGAYGDRLSPPKRGRRKKK